jgi:hypothetical protein
VQWVQRSVPGSKRKLFSRRNYGINRLGGVVVSVLATGSNDYAGSNPDEAIDFQGDDNIQHTFFGGEVKL